jgi:4-hydroxybenzoyl-CoA thioesterase
MFKNSRTWIVEWGDCDPAGIVFYPRFFAAFDTSTSRLLEAATGRKKSEIIRSNGIIGWPMVDTRAKFGAPATYGDEVVIETEIVKVGRSSFELVHRLSKDGVLSVEGRETRVWTGRAEDEPSRICAVPLPEKLAEILRDGA